MQSLSGLIMCTNRGGVNNAVGAARFRIAVQQRRVDVVNGVSHWSPNGPLVLAASRECLHSLLPRWRWWLSLAVAERSSGEAAGPKSLELTTSNVACSRCHCCANSQL
jgi:hypothetical protein